jgi:hypothetical protein
MNNYPIILGAGGFGVVRTGSRVPYSQEAVKFLNDGTLCREAKREFMLHKRFYDAWTTFDHFTHKNNLTTSCYVPTPVDYSDINTHSCTIITERLFTVHPQGDYLIHIALTENVPPGLINRLVSVQFTDEASQLYRGYFYNEEFLRRITTMPVDEMVRSIGQLVGIAIFGALVDPFDVEFVLCQTPHGIRVAAIDFGKVEPLVTFNTIEADAIAQHIDYDMYYTPATGEYNDAYYRGISEAYECFHELVPPLFYEKVLVSLSNLI